MSPSDMSSRPPARAHFIRSAEPCRPTAGRPTTCRPTARRLLFCELLAAAAVAWATVSAGSSEASEHAGTDTPSNRGFAAPSGTGSLRPRVFSARPIDARLQPVALAEGKHPRAGVAAVRGLTIGPIESRLQGERGYGSPAYERTLDEVVRAGGNWVSLTVFGRVWDAGSAGVALDFERPFPEVRENVGAAVEQAHRRGLRVLLVPHLWLESGEWRAEMNPGSEQRWRAWARSYRRFVLAWARVAESSGVDLLAAGVELRSWVTTARAPSFVSILGDIRQEYHGLLTYAANWDDAEDTVIWGHVDWIGVNAFYPLHWENDATREQLRAGGERAAAAVAELRSRYDKPVFFSEFGYTARANTAIEPWLWPEQLSAVQKDEAAQAEAYAALLSQLPDVPGFGGTFVWRIYADLADTSQEPDWGFSPWGKRAQGVLRSAFRAHFWADGEGGPSLPHLLPGEGP